MRRDEQHFRNLKAIGWDCTIIWECELQAAAEALVEHLNAVKQSVS